MITALRTPLIAPERLARLEDRVQRALATGDQTGLDVLGYGEITSVLRLHSDGRAFAVKRLPPLANEAAHQSYTETLAAYLLHLNDRGVSVTDTRVQAVPLEDGRRAVYLVQPAEAPTSLVVPRLREATPAEATVIFDRILDAIDRAHAPGVGLDGQLSNWAFDDAGRLRYLDVSTPLLQDAHGRERLDLEIFVASLPWLARGVVRRFLLKGILATYYDQRAIIRDLLANMLKERLDHLLPIFLQRAGERVDRPISEREVRSYYRSDARTWAFLLAARRLDQWWQLSVRRRPYAFLLPGPVAR